MKATVSCPGGGQAFQFESMWIAGNPATEVEVRPFMHPVPEEAPIAACAALRR